MSATVDLALPVATEGSAARLLTAKAMTPAMAAPIPFGLISLITAGPIIMKPRRAIRSD
jgi:hypothetical protein